MDFRQFAVMLYGLLYMFYIVRAQPYFVGNRCNRLLDCTMDILMAHYFYIQIQLLRLYTLREKYVYTLLIFF